MTVKIQYGITPTDLGGIAGPPHPLTGVGFEKIVLYNTDYHICYMFICSWKIFIPAHSDYLDNLFCVLILTLNFLFE
jgi:hypothetical protein